MPFLPAVTYLELTSALFIGGGRFIEGEWAPDIGTRPLPFPVSSVDLCGVGLFLFKSVLLLASSEACNGIGEEMAALRDFRSLLGDLEPVTDLLGRVGVTFGLMGLEGTVTCTRGGECRGLTGLFFIPTSSYRPESVLVERLREGLLGYSAPPSMALLDLLVRENLRNPSGEVSVFDSLLAGLGGSFLLFVPPVSFFCASLGGSLRVSLGGSLRASLGGSLCASLSGGLMV